MDKQRWQYIKALSPHPGRYAHVSAQAGMERHPLDTGHAQTMPLVPRIEKPGHTFCENRSAKKQANRENAARAKS